MNKIKSYKEFIMNESINFEDSLNDANKILNDYNITLDDKKEIASKYGINSKKKDEIAKGIYEILWKEHFKKSTWNDNDFLAYWKYWNGPTTTIVLKKALANETQEWIEFCKEHTLSYMKEHFRSSYVAKELPKVEKAYNGFLNKIKNLNDVNRTALIELLYEKTKDFHDKHIQNVTNWAINSFDNNYAMKDFTINDFMSYFGICNREYVAKELQQKHFSLYNSYNSHLRKCSGYIHPYSVSYKAKGNIKFFGDTIKPNDVKVYDNSYSSYSNKDLMQMVENDSFTDIPSESCLRIYNNFNHVKIESNGWNKKTYIDKQVLDAENDYRNDMEVIADRIRKMNMNESNIDVEFIAPDAKHYDITIFDGEKRVHARSIFAAEFSIYKSPHYRFIIS